MFEVKPLSNEGVIARIRCERCEERATAIGPDIYTAVIELRYIGWFGLGSAYDDDGRRLVLCPGCDSGSTGDTNG